MSQDSDETDARILDAARRLLDEHGPGFTMAQLAERSGVSRATLYRRVPSREALAERLREAGVDPGEALGSSARERILDALHSMIAAQGLLFTVEQVAERADVGVATIYRSFGDREGLLREFFDERGPRRVAAARLRDPEASVEEVIGALVGSLLRFVVEYPGLARAVLLVGGPDAEEIQRLRRGGRSTFSRLLDFTRAKVEAGQLVGEPFVLVSSLVGMVLGAGLLAPQMAGRVGKRGRVPPALSADDPEGIERRAQQLVALWLKGASS